MNREYLDMIERNDADNDQVMVDEARLAEEIENYEEDEIESF